MHPVAIGAFGDEVVDAAWDFRLTQDRKSPSSEINGEGDAHLVAIVLDIEDDDRTPQYVTGVEQLEHNARCDGMRASVGQADDLAEEADDVLMVVERFGRLDVDLVTFDQLLDMFRIRFLNHGRVEQHGCT